MSTVEPVALSGIISGIRPTDIEMEIDTTVVAKFSYTEQDLSSKGEMLDLVHIWAWELQDDGQWYCETLDTRTVSLRQAREIVRHRVIELVEGSRDGTR